MLTKDEAVKRVVAAQSMYAFPTVSELKVEQGQEEDIQEVVKWLEAGSVKRKGMKTPSGVYGGSNLMYMVMRKGLLFFRHEIGKGEILTEAVVMPKVLQRQTLRSLHDSPLFGHPGRRATQFTVQSKCFWGPHQVKDIMKYLKNCLECKKGKVFRRTHAGNPRRQMYFSRGDMMCFDLVGSFVAVEGMKWIAHATNPCTGFNYTGALPNKKSETVATWMHDLFMKVGWPSRVLTDNGGEFCSEVQDALTETFGYQHIRCCPKSPKGNSFNETRHRTMNAMLKICCKKYGKSWLKGLPYITWALNVRQYRSSEICPFECEYGSPPPTMGDLSMEEMEREFDGEVSVPKSFKSPEMWVRDVRKNTKEAIMIYCFARAQTMKENDAGCTFYPRNHLTGSLVIVNRPIVKKGQTSRLVYQCIGPFEVVGPACPPNSDGSFNAYRLKCLATEKISPFNVTDIHDYLEPGEKGNWEGEEEEKEEQEEEEKQEEEEEKEEFNPGVGDFLLFPNFGDVKYHLIQVTGRPSNEMLAFNYFGTTSKDRLTKFAKVWTHEEKPEIQSNQLVIKAGYEVEEHELPIEEVCQKVIIPKEYKEKGSGKSVSRVWYKLTEEQIEGVLSYSACQ